ncbi:hypothetical protein [Roseibacillus ishigakijimensis]|uniref:hypothetical protein n=1 Tax=Roseibacillus ishigakijimensis TaxID=454146 RepID=UPI001904910D|nr:hypothetical protein [Roseibacillus ishigakijimensis]
MELVARLMAGEESRAAFRASTFPAPQTRNSAPGQLPALFPATLPTRLVWQ